MNKFWKFGTILVGIVTVFVVVGAAMTFAQEDTGTPGTTPAIFMQQEDGEGEQGEQPQIIDHEAVVEAIANALGITVEEVEAAKEEGTQLSELAESLGVDIADVEAAIQEVKEEAVNQALEDGTITEEQAERILSGEGRRGGKGGRGNGGGLLREIIDQDAMNTAVADALGITVEELDAAKEEGTRLSELAEELGVDIAEVEAAKEAVVQEAVDQALEDGTITEEQAERILSGEGHRGGKGGRGNGGGLLREIVDQDAMNTAISDALGITVEELEAAKEDGTRLSELAEELGVDIAEVEAAKEAVVQEAVDQALEDGTITEEQAERILSGEGCKKGGRGNGNGPAPEEAPADNA